MIEAYCGLIGSGKSYSAVVRMLRYMAKGGCVVSNIKLCIEPWMNTHALFAGKFRPDANAMGVREYLRRAHGWTYQEGQYRYVDNSRLLTNGVTGLLPAGLPDLPVLLVWDEGADFWDTDERANADKEFLSLLRHSRKLGMDFVFVVQEFTELNKRIRNQTAWVWRFIDMATFRIPGLGIGISWVPMLNNQIRVLQFNRAHFETKRDTVEPVFSGWLDKKQDIFSCYKTDALHVGVSVLMGEKVDFRGKGRVVLDEVSDRFSFAVGFCLALLFFLVGGWL
jgi:hypothetical protein